MPMNQSRIGVFFYRVFFYSGFFIRHSWSFLIRAVALYGREADSNKNRMPSLPSDSICSEPSGSFSEASGFPRPPDSSSRRYFSSSESSVFADRERYIYVFPPSAQNVIPCVFSGISHSCSRTGFFMSRMSNLRSFPFCPSV